MNLYIQIENGLPINHPAYDDNLIEAFGSIPSNWEPFVRVERPIPKIYEVLEDGDPTYQKINGVWTDVWPIRNMTQAEIDAKQQLVQNGWKNQRDASNYDAWTFDAEICKYVPPISKPDDGKDYFWQGTTNSWVVMPEYPTDGKNYQLDFATATWVAQAITPVA